MTDLLAFIGWGVLFIASGYFTFATIVSGYAVLIFGNRNEILIPIGLSVLAAISWVGTYQAAPFTIVIGK